MDLAVNAWIRRLPLACIPLTALTLTGCASPGAVRPPSLHLPAVPNRVSASRAGDVVTLAWTTPARSTDGVSLQGKHNGAPFTTEICREADPLPPLTVPCLPLTRQPAEAGVAASLQGTLPPELADGPPRGLRYRIRVLNKENRGSGYAVVSSVAGRAPAPVRNLRATAAIGGAELQWQQESAAPGERMELRVVRGDARGEGTLLRLESGDGDPGGTIDGGARRGVEQRYTVYRVQTVTVSGNRYSLTSSPAQVTLAADAVAPPPAPPTGLEAVANTLGAPQMDLVWQPSDGAVAYIVYRAEGDGAPVAITPQPVRGFSYADKTSRPGVRYRYSVAAVGQDGRPGTRSAEAAETIGTQ